MIKYEAVTKKYEDKDLSLEDISLEIKKGEMVVLTGHSGAGKTTFIRLLLAEEKPTSGKVYFNDYDVHALRGGKISEHRRKIGVIFQDFKLLAKKTVFENVSFAMEVSGASDKEILDSVPHVLELVGLASKSDRFPYQLSGGEKQRLAIARAIVNSPDVVIADEPTGNLDSDATSVVSALLEKINKSGATVILVTHDVEVLKSTSKKRVVVLENGKIISDSKK